MKKLFFSICMILFIFSSVYAEGFSVAAFATHTDFDACCSDQPIKKNDGSAGIYLEHLSGKSFIYGVEIYYANNNPGLSLKFGTTRIPGRFTFGVGYYEDKITKLVNVAGVYVNNTTESFEPVFFAEYEYSGFFVRASILDSSVDLTPRRQTGTDIVGNPVYTYVTETVRTQDKWLWAGYRLSF